jgi:basic membrane protein A
MSGCSPAPNCFGDEIYCAALVTDTNGLNDFGHSQNTWAGLEQSKADGVVDQIAHIESVDTRDYEKNIAFFVDAGYDVIITSGVGMRDVTLHSADLNPATVFIGMGQTFEESLPNLIPVTFPEDEMGFLAGALAAGLTETNIVGAVCETSGIDAMWRYCEGFRAGVAYVDESVEVTVIYRDHGNRDLLFIDEEWGTENAKDLIQSGADVIFAVGGETGVSALRAVTAAGIKAIGVERDQGRALGEDGSEVVTSILGQSSSTVQGLVRALRGGNPIQAGDYPINYIPFDFRVQTSDIIELDEILIRLESGEIKTNVTSRKP